MENVKLISQGAEGKLYESTYLGKPSIIKERLSKRYRVPELDTKLNKQRLLQEARCMARCLKAGIRTPCIYFVDTMNCHLHIERIIGLTVKEYLFSSYNSFGSYPVDSSSIAHSIGVIIGKMHDAEVVHGDLTTSNIMINNSISEDSANAKIVLIDFGLANMKPIAEDKAVDLYVLERAFISTHPDSEYMVQAILDGYKNSSTKSPAILSKLEQVRLRGRKRDMFG